MTKRPNISGAIGFTEIVVYNSTKSLPFYEHCNNIHSFSQFRERHESFFIQYICKLLKEGLLMYLSL